MKPTIDPVVIESLSLIRADEVMKDRNEPTPFCDCSPRCSKFGTIWGSKAMLMNESKGLGNAVALCLGDAPEYRRKIGIYETGLKMVHRIARFESPVVGVN